MNIDINNLQEGECLVSDVDINLCNTLQLTDIQLESYENLYESYINKTCEEAYSFNENKFKSKYLDLISKKNILSHEIIKTSLGLEYYDLIKTKYGYQYNIDYNTKTLIITIRRVNDDNIS